MLRYVFNEEYFRICKWEDCGKTIDEKYEYLGKKLIQNAEQIKKKRLEQGRHFTEADYEQIKPMFPLLLLDTDLVVKKLIIRSNLDLSPNERLVLYFMLDYIAAEEKTDRKKCVTPQDLYDRIGDKKNMKKLKIINAMDKLHDKGLCEKEAADEQYESEVSSDTPKRERLTKEELEGKMKMQYTLKISNLIEFATL